MLKSDGEFGVTSVSTLKTRHTNKEM